MRSNSTSGIEMNELRLWMALWLLLPAVLLVFVAPDAAGATTHTCGSNWCSGSDTSTGVNSQGNAPQEYVGEMGEFFVRYGNPQGFSIPCEETAGDPEGGCWSTSGAAGAKSRYIAGTGMGGMAYYFTGGDDTRDEGNYSSPYCWGVAQGLDAIRLANTTSYEFWGNWNIGAIFLDIEQNNTFGWYDTSDYASNRQVFDGMTDYVAGRTVGSCATQNTNDPEQYAAYSSPDQWDESFDWLSSSSPGQGSIGNTPVWTSENCCSSTDPLSFTGGKEAAWFGGSSYNWMWQFGEAPDYDLLYEPIYLPVFGFSIGD